MNDWGIVYPAPYNGEAMAALIDCGQSAQALLTPLLEDQTRVYLIGSAEATVSIVYEYRKADYAYRALAQIFGFGPDLSRDLNSRDEAIARLKQHRQSYRN